MDIVTTNDELHAVATESGLLRGGDHRWTAPGVELRVVGVYPRFYLDVDPSDTVECWIAMFTPDVPRAALAATIAAAVQQHGGTP